MIIEKLGVLSLLGGLKSIGLLAFVLPAAAMRPVAMAAAQAPQSGARVIAADAAIASRSGRMAIAERLDGIDTASWTVGAAAGRIGVLHEQAKVEVEAAESLLQALRKDIAALAR